MAEFPVPLIDSEDDYDTIRNLPGSDLPQTFDEWKQERAKEDLDIARSSSSIIVRGFKINPNEFSDFCKRLHIPADREAIKAFVQKKASGKSNDKR